MYVALIAIWGQVIKHPFDLGCVVLVLLIFTKINLKI